MILSKQNIIKIIIDMIQKFDTNINNIFTLHMRPKIMDEEKTQALNTLISSIQDKLNEKKSEDSPNLSSLLNNINNNTSNNTSDSSIDPSTLLKISKIMSKMNSNSPQKELLLSLKPFLRKSRQDKMENYITILNVISILDSLKDKGSD